MSKKIIFKGNPDGCYLPFEPDLLQTADFFILARNLLT